jgi:hypothetical protein
LFNHRFSLYHTYNLNLSMLHTLQNPIEINKHERKRKTRNQSSNRFDFKNKNVIIANKIKPKIFILEFLYNSG